MIIDGKKLALHIEREIKEKLERLPKKKVCFVVFQPTPAIEQFVQMKMRVGSRLGVECEVLRFNGTINNENAVHFLDEILGKNYNGIVIQLPLPKELDADLILNKIPSQLDIDVLGKASLQDYLHSKGTLVPPVAKAVSEILRYAKVNFINKNILIIGNGRLVGQVVSLYFTKYKIPFSLITEKSEEIIAYNEKIKNADVIISGVGSPYFIKKEMIKDGVIIIDAGTSEQEGKLVGDVDPGCASVSSFITPVPGGVGPLAVISLFNNLI
jgi:methylenetetrahydrofolate dehydrogenase (NADP+) / methenyltetrahydrofolate cyclohydrolase